MQKATVSPHSCILSTVLPEQGEVEISGSAYKACFWNHLVELIFGLMHRASDLPEIAHALLNSDHTVEPLRHARTLHP